MSPEMSTALTTRQELMEARATALADKAVEAGEPWLTRLGTPPATDAARGRWLNAVRTVAAYRDRYHVKTSSALDEPRSEAQKLDATHAQQAIRRARVIAQQEASPRNGDDSRTVRLPGQIIDSSASTRPPF
jgi:hypothetical protein